MPLIAVTGATGAIGGAVAALLGQDVGRLVVRDRSRAPRIPGDPDVHEASYGDEPAMRAALEGVDVLLLVSAAEAPGRLDQHRAAVRAAAASGVGHIVYTSFDGAAPDAVFTLARDHWYTEQAIRDAGMAFTFLRDCFYLDFFPAFAGEDGAIRGPAGSGRVAAVARADVSAVAAAVLRDPSAHRDEVLRLTGPEAISMAEAASRLTAALGRPFTYVEQTLDEAYASRRAFTDEQWQLDAWVSTYTAIASGDLAAVCGDVPALLGRPARNLEAAVRGA